MFSITTAWYFGLGLVSGKAADRFGPRPVLLVAAGMLGVALARHVAGPVDLGRLRHLRARRRHRRRLRLRADGRHRRGVVRAPPHDRARRGRGRHRRRHARAGPAVGAAHRRVRLADGLRRARCRRGRPLLLLASLGAHRPPLGPQQAPAPMRQIVRDRGFVILYVVLPLCCRRRCSCRSCSSSPTPPTRASTPDAAATLVGIIGASSVVGRLGLGGPRRPARRHTSDAGQLRDPHGQLPALARLPATATRCSCCSPIVMGVAYGGFIALAPAVAAGLFGTVGLGAILGTLYTAAAIGGLVGPPIVGDDHRPGLLRGRASWSPWCLTGGRHGRAVHAAGRPRPAPAAFRQPLTPIPPSGWRNVPVMPRDGRRPGTRSSRRGRRA